MHGDSSKWNATAACLAATIVVCLLVVEFTERIGHLFRAELSSSSSFPSSSISSGLSQQAWVQATNSYNPETIAKNTVIADSTSKISSRYKISMRFPATEVGGDNGPDSIIDLRDGAGAYDAGFVCRVFELDNLRPAANRGQDAHVVQIDPIVSTINGYSSPIHHMDIFACQSSVEDEVKLLHGRKQESSWCRSDKFLDTSCRQLLWAYDRGAASYEFPNVSGMLLGPSSGFSHMLLQLHYLLPEKFTAAKKNGGRVEAIVDSSGFELVLDGNLREYDAGLFGFLDMSIEVPVGEPAFRFENHISSIELAGLVSTDLLQFKELQPFAVHLHAHDHATSVTLTHYRGRKELKTYAHLVPFHGYGADQTFMPLPKNAETLKAGDSLTFTCVFNSTGSKRPLYYGVSHGDEMCAPLVLYYPHTRGMVGYDVMNMASYDRSMSRADDASEQVVLDLIGKGKTGKLRKRL